MFELDLFASIIAARGPDPPPVLDGGKPWECLIDAADARVHKRPAADSTSQNYRSFQKLQVTPISVFQMNWDLPKRAEWDENCGEAKVLQSLEDGTEIAYWIVKYPWPMSSRDYVYARKAVLDAATGAIVTVARACTHPSMPPKPGMVRVTNFHSNFIIMPASGAASCSEVSWNMFEDPGGSIPSTLINWATSKAIPTVLKQQLLVAQRFQRGDISSTVELPRAVRLPTPEQ